MLRLKAIPLAAAFAAVAFLLQGCAEKIDARQAEDNNGLIYKHGSNEPFSGIITNFANVPMLDPTAGYQVAQWLGRTAVLVGKPTCTVSLKQGLLEGESTCTYDNGQPAGIYHFSEGKMDGDFKRYDTDGKLIYEATWAKGSRVSERDYVKEAAKPHEEAATKEQAALNKVEEQPEFRSYNGKPQEAA